MLPQRYGVPKDLATDTEGKPQAGALPQSLFRFHSIMFGYIYTIVVLRRVTPVLDPGLIVFEGSEAWAAVGRELILC
jgi:hypothetical protein